jgi:DNA-binding MarR family transcriptional regulator
MQDAVDEILALWRRERPDLEPGLWAMGLVGRVQRLNRLIERELKAYFARYGMELWEMDVLFTLRRAGPPHTLTPGELLKAVMVTSGAMTNRIDRLAAKGLVERQPGPGDRRSVGVRLTERAMELVDRVLTDHLANEATLFAALSEAERGELAELLRRTLAGLGDSSIR